MNGRERRLERNVAASAGRTRGGYGDRPVLIIHSDAPAYGLQCYAGEGGGHAGVAFNVSRGDRAVAVFRG